MLSRRCTIQHLCNLQGDTIRRHDERRVQMHVALRDTTRRMAQQTRDRKLGKSKVASDASEGMSQDMRCYVLELRFRAHAVEDTNNSDEMATSPVSWKDKRRIVTRWHGLNAVHRSFPKYADLRTALGVRKADAVVLSAKPMPLQSQRFHPPKPRQ